MGEDREILREIWDGRIPISFSLSSDDCCTLSPPDPHYLMVPRMSYFPIVLDKVKKYFTRSINSELKIDEIWLDFEGIPLKWNYPIGVLFDLHTGGKTIPWPLTVHFSNFPEESIIRCRSREAIESQFLASVKEADAFKHRGQVVKNMQMQDHKQLWTGLCNDKFDQFWTINRKLMDCNGEEGFKNIPFRLFLKDEVPIQRLQKPFGEDGSRLTLEDLLKNVLPRTLNENYRVTIQGIEPPWDTPLQWLSEHLSHPDNFLYICVLQSEL
ncbi:UNVERIFIED_CONTAM: hypothetical protein RMT77_007635 [Armadillidium vulgare]